jgi:alpha-tubulin suppressor-like RCC1 family protein
MKRTALLVISLAFIVCACSCANTTANTFTTIASTVASLEQTTTVQTTTPATTSQKTTIETIPPTTKAEPVFQIANLQKEAAKVAGNIMASMYSFAITKDGTVLQAGYDPGYPAKLDVTGWKDIAALSGGLNHIAGLRSDGTVVATGFNGINSGMKDYYRVKKWKDIVAISACGDGITIGLKADRTVVVSGLSFYDSSNPNNVDTWTDIVAIAAGGGFVAGARSDGTVFAVGDKNPGRISSPYQPVDIVPWR